MTITQTVKIPANRRITLEIPPQIPAGSVILTFTPACSSIPKKDPLTVAEAMQMAEKQAVDPNRKPVSRHFGKYKGIFGGDGMAYQKAIRDEWD